MSTLKVNRVQSITKYPPFILNSSGEEIGKFASAWVVFKGDGSIYNSSNIISITNSGSAKFQISCTPNLRINNPAISGSTSDGSDVVSCHIFDSGISDRRNQQSVFGSSIRVVFNAANASTVSAHTGGTYYSVSVVGDNEYASAGNIIPTA